MMMKIYLEREIFFGSQVMTLLEFLSRLCSNDTTAKEIRVNKVVYRGRLFFLTIYFFVKVITKLNKNGHTLYEEIQVTLRLKKSIAFVGHLIAYQQNKTFDDFVSEEFRQVILAIGPDHLNDNQPLKEYAKHLRLEGE